MHTTRYAPGLVVAALLAIAGCTSDSCTKCAAAAGGSSGVGGAFGRGGTGGGCAGSNGLGGGGFIDGGDRLACGSPPCAHPTCEPTWAAALSNPGYCRRDALGYYRIGTCAAGGTILVHLMEAWETDCYYDAAGAIVASVEVGIPGVSTVACTYGPAGGFTPPDCTGGGAFFSDQPICAADAGRD